jgi:high mobility group protein B1
MGDVRGEVKRKNPNFSIGEVAKEIGRRWRELSASKKGPYEKKAAKLKAKYWEDKAQYEAELAEEEE